MIKPVWINIGGNSTGINIANAEKHYSGKYLGCFCLKAKIGWTEDLYACFYNAEPEKSEYSNYFGLRRSRDGAFITNAISITEGYWYGIVADNGEIIYSRARHDFRTSADESVSVDGGRDITRMLGNINNPKVRISIINDNLVVNDSLFLPTAPIRELK